MSWLKKTKHKGEKAEGVAKEKTGQATGDRKMEAKGRGKQASADVKQAGDKAADAVDDAIHDE